MINTYLRRFERGIVLVLLLLMILVVLLATAELVAIILEEMTEPPRKFLLNIEELLDIFGFFMMILIGLELIETIKVYLKTDSLHVEPIFLVAIIAVTRKVIILDIKKVEPMALLGVAAIILALSAGYYFLKLGLRVTPSEPADSNAASRSNSNNVESE
jgi:uncharacterized membrane protein (DUF373 family)